MYAPTRILHTVHTQHHHRQQTSRPDDLQPSLSSPYESGAHTRPPGHNLPGSAFCPHSSLPAGSPSAHDELQGIVSADLCPVCAGEGFTTGLLRRSQDSRRRPQLVKHALGEAISTLAICKAHPGHASLLQSPLILSCAATPIRQWLLPLLFHRVCLSHQANVPSSAKS